MARQIANARQPTRRCLKIVRAARFAHGDGDLGVSLSSNEPVAFRIAQRLPNTLLLAGTALVVSILVGIPMGVVAALRAGLALDRGPGPAGCSPS